jgi:hypothetical protein
VKICVEKYSKKRTVADFATVLFLTQKSANGFYHRLGLFRMEPMSSIWDGDPFRIWKMGVDVRQILLLYVGRIRSSQK